MESGSHYITLTIKFAKALLPPESLDADAAYQDICNITKKAVKKTIPRGRANNYISCWDAECEFLCTTFLQSPQEDNSNLAAIALLAKVDRKQSDRWSKAVTDFEIFLLWKTFWTAYCMIMSNSKKNRLE